jgi:hypothetical protein
MDTFGLRTFFILVLPLAGVAQPPPIWAESISFRTDVMAVLSKGGCNQGACHGNQNGKNGFRLSLRGEDPAFDYSSLTHDMLGRRINSQRPAESLLLLKATAAVPHEGGKRFGVGSLEYAILFRWIAAGLPTDGPKSPVLERMEVSPTEQIVREPADRVQLRVRAIFSDGVSRDVSHLAVYEPSSPIIELTPAGEVHRQQSGEATILVRYLDRRVAVRLAFAPERSDFRWQDRPVKNFIDQLVFAKLQALRVQPSEVCTDSVFLRRAFLDALGILPTPEEVRGFLEDRSTDKRARLIDRLVERPEFAEFWALKWSDLLRNEEKVLDRKGVQVFHDWMRQSIAERKPLNEFARELAAGRGSTYANPPANFYRALRDPQVRAETVAQVFLGTRLQCARCHNHPFDRWTQNDFYGLAAFFARVEYKVLENRRPDNLDTHQFDGEQIVCEARRGEVRNPRTGAIAHPRFLGEDTPTNVADADRLRLLADWIARPDNPFFARTQVNRIWFHLMGRGIVEPDDDFRASNPPSNGPLLEALVHDFIAHRFNLRHAVRMIMNSTVYQLSAEPNATNQDDEINFSHMLVRPLQAEQLLDALAQVTEVPVKFNGYPLGLRAGQVPGVRPVGHRTQRPTAGEEFLQRFGKPERLLSCDCERSDDTTVAQAFQLLTGPALNRMLSEPHNRIGRLLAHGASKPQIVEECYLAAFSRFPTPSEQSAALAYLQHGKNGRATLEDLLWGLVNAKEFLLRQ